MPWAGDALVSSRCVNDFRTPIIDSSVAFERNYSARSPSEIAHAPAGLPPVATSCAMRRTSDLRPGSSLIARASAGCASYRQLEHLEEQALHRLQMTARKAATEFDHDGQHGPFSLDRIRLSMWTQPGNAVDYPVPHRLRTAGRRRKKPWSST